MYGIYKITNLINNKHYIGKSSSILDRWEYHKQRYNDEKEYDKLLYKAFRKYGLDNFEFSILEEMTEQEYNKFANNREEYWILYYDANINGYNLTDGGDGGYNEKALQANRKLTVEEVKQIRQMYLDCNICYSDAYELYKDKISKRGFHAVWLGQNYKAIMPEVFNEETKQKHNLLEHRRTAQRRKNKT